EPCFLCLTKSSEVEKSQMNQILLHQLTITWLPNLSKTRRKYENYWQKRFQEKQCISYYFILSSLLVYFSVLAFTHQIK
ncbi:hypothetical protein E2320_020881, partial [Naja naja]